MYHPIRDGRFEYVTDAIEHIELRNCSLGCKFAIDATEEFPGGSCELLVKIVLEEDVEEIEDRGYEGLHCNKREPLPPVKINTTKYKDQPSLLDLLGD